MNTYKNDTRMEGRILSIDALRGFTMFWIISGGFIFRALPDIFDSVVFKTIADQLEHVEWHGFHFYDLIFPMFLFIIGITIPISYKRRLEKGDTKPKLYKHLAIRTITLFALGLLCFGYRSPDLIYDGYVIGYYGVLQLLAFACFFASLIVYNTSVRGTILWTTGIFVFYFLIMVLYPVPGYGIGNFARGANFNDYIANWVSTAIGIKWKYILSPFMLNTIPTALFGVLTGYWLQSKNKSIKKFKYLVIAGITLVCSGVILSLIFPINKNLWSSSYLLLSGGLSLLFLALFYWLIDILNYKKWAFMFVVIGLNSITIYMLAHLINFREIGVFVTYGFIHAVGSAGNFVIALAAFLSEWFLLYYLYKQKIFIKL